MGPITQRRVWSSLLPALICAAALAGCQSGGLRSPVAIDSPQALVGALQAAGAVVTPVPGEALLSTLDGQLVLVNGERIQVGPADGSHPVEAPQGGELVWTGPGWYAAYRGHDGALIVLLSGLLGDPLRPTPLAADEPYPPVVPLAMRSLARATGHAPQEIEVLAYRAVIWPDACLGIEQPGQVCAEVETPGWLIDASLAGRVYHLHSDESGAAIVWDDRSSTTQPTMGDDE